MQINKKFEHKRVLYIFSATIISILLTSCQSNIGRPADEEVMRALDQARADIAREKARVLATAAPTRRSLQTIYVQPGQLKITSKEL